VGAVSSAQRGKKGGKRSLYLISIQENKKRRQVASPYYFHQWRGTPRREKEGGKKKRGGEVGISFLGGKKGKHAFYLGLRGGGGRIGRRGEEARSIYRFLEREEDGKSFEYGREKLEH